MSRIPQAVDRRASAAGLRTVAVFEASKGVLVVVLAIILIAVRGRNRRLYRGFSLLSSPRSRPPFRAHGDGSRC